jgi:CRP-like cAMP-binding protein
MAHDRVDGDELPLTHEFLALMLGVRRSGVTVALKILEREGMVTMRRGGVVIIDPDGLEECANGAYIRPEAELRR